MNEFREGPRAGLERTLARRWHRPDGFQRVVMNKAMRGGHAAYFIADEVDAWLKVHAHPEAPVARVGDVMLYQEDIDVAMKDGEITSVFVKKKRRVDIRDMRKPINRAERRRLAALERKDR